jgi:hypothetical protein
VFNFHYCVPPDTVALNYGLNKVIGENETGFRGKADVLYRTEGWDFLIAGGALYNNLDYSFTAAHPAGTFTEYQSPGGGSERLRKQLGILKSFLEGFEYVHMQPDNSVLRDVPAATSVRALVHKGRAYAIYVHVDLPNKPTNLAELERKESTATFGVDLPAGRYRVEWLNPVTGQIDGTEEIMHAGGVRKVTPVFIVDVALRIVGL